MKRMILFLAAVFPVLGLHGAQVGQTTVAKWKDDKAGVFLLMFDDGWPSHVLVAIPELQKRGLAATFYLNPGKGEYGVFKEKWEQECAQLPGVVFADHTMFHKGVKDVEEARAAIGDCARIVRELQPGKPDRLVSFGRPGVGPGNWNITKEEQAQILQDYHLIDRPPFTNHGAVYHKKTLEEMTALIDKAIASKDMEYLVVHGVERPESTRQDMWPLSLSIFLPLLDYMKEKSDACELWVTDHISQHQYQTEREQAKVEVVGAGQSIRLKLASGADPALYDLPLTLLTSVPGTWQKVKVTQGDRTQTVAVVDGVAKYDAVPDGTEIVLSPE